MPMRTIELAGAPLEMGRQYGEELRQAAREMIGTRLQLATQAARQLDPPRDLQWCLDLAAESVPMLQEYSQPVFEEFQGISEATGLSLPELVIGNGWTDFKDLLSARGEAHNCTSLAIGPGLTADGHTYLAQTWDMNVTAAPYIALVRRQPADGPQTLSLTTAGCLSLIGMNEHGIAVGNTNLTPTDARPGVFYLALIHEALGRATLDDAVAAIAQAPRMSGHYYYLGDAHGGFRGLETTATAFAEVSWHEGRYAHANHFMSEKLLETELTTPAGANTLGRQERCEALLAGMESDSSAAKISQILGDHAGKNPICRHADPGAEYATLASAVMCPADRRMWVCAGNPCTHQVVEFTL